MRIFRLLLAVTTVLGALGLVSQSRAEPTAPVATPVDAPAPADAPAPQDAPAPLETLPRFALAVNAPTGWAISSFGASPYLRLGDHVALRGSIANYRYNGPPASIFAGFTEGGTGYGGRVTDIGIAVVVYPRRAWDGPVLEAGVLRRDRDVYVWPEFEEKAYTRSTVYAGRALIGWSWLIRERVFIAVAAGVSVGREHGTTTQDMLGGRSPTMSRVDRQTVDAEEYVRIGVVFGR